MAVKHTTLEWPDHLGALDALTCARRLAAYRVNTAYPHPDTDPGWPGLIGVEDIARFDPIALWDNQKHGSQLRVPIGTTADGGPLELDIKEPAEGGMGPHGLCVGATGSGKSELLRTVALGMIASNSPEMLNLLLIDFKGGATFLDLAQSPARGGGHHQPRRRKRRWLPGCETHLAGEMNRRQQLLRTAGCVSVARYQLARRLGKQLAALPTLFIIVDEFSELLSQHPDFADMFVAIGRLGRSLGMHLLLASQRLDEGRLRGLESHLSYRLCLKTLSVSESRAVLGTADAFQLPATPGAGILRSGSGEPIRFQAAFVSGPLGTTLTGCASASRGAIAKGAAVHRGGRRNSHAARRRRCVTGPDCAASGRGQAGRAGATCLPSLAAAPGLSTATRQLAARYRYRAGRIDRAPRHR